MSWRDAPLIEAAPAWASAPEIATPPPREASSRTNRFLTGLADPIYGAAQIADKVLVNPIRQAISPGASSMEDVIRQRDKDYVAPEGIDWMRMGGNVANPVNFAAPGAGLARAAGMGAVQSALAPVDPDADFATEKAKQMALGGAAGGVLSKVLPRAMGGLVKPTDDALALQRAGVTLTPGQAAGGFLNRVEQRSMSVPIVGDIIGHARRRSLDDFQREAIKRATGTRAKTVDEANAIVSDLYQEVVPKLKPTGEAETEVLGAIVKAADNPELTKDNLKILEGLHDKLFGKGGERYMQLSGDALKDLDTELGALVRKYGKSVLPSDQTLADEIRNVQQEMRKAWRYHLDPADATKLDAANQAYARMIPVNKASSGRADERVMPRALQKALAQQAGRDVSRMPKDDLITTGVRVLPNDVPNSGTAERLMNPLGVGVSAAEPISAILTALGTGTAYSRRGVNILTGNTAVQRELAKLEPKTRAAVIAAIRSQQAGVADKE